MSGPAGRAAHPLTAVTGALPEWVRWVLHGIVLGSPLDADAAQRHIADADPAPPLPDAPELDGGERVRLVELRLGPGCYGLAEGAVIRFGRRLTLVHGGNGAGKSSLARVLRAVAGRPSAQRPPHDAFTGVAGEAVLRVERAGRVEDLARRAGGPGAPLHVDVFDSADTRIEGSEYQLRPRSVVALEDLRGALDALQVVVEPLELPAGLADALTDDDRRALDGPGAREVLDDWLAAATPAWSTSSTGSRSPTGSPTPT